MTWLNRKHAPLILLIALYITAGCAQMLALPFMEGGDEWHHYNVIQHIRQTQTLPDRTTSLTNPMRQASGQAPLHYALTAVVLNTLNQPITDGDALQDHLLGIAKNPWYTPPDLWNRTDNRNVFLHTPNLALPQYAGVMWITRGMSLIFGVIAVIAAYGVACQLFVRSTWRLTMTAIFALMPMYVQLTAITRNDSAAIALTTLTLWAILFTHRTGITWPRLILISVLIGIGGLIKINTLVVAPSAVMLIMLDSLRNRSHLLRRLGQIVAITLPALILFAPWAVFGYLTWGDPLGVNTHNIPGHYRDPALNIPQMIALLPTVYVSYLGQFGSATYLHPATYTALGVIVIGAIFGWVRLVFNRYFRVQITRHQIEQAAIVGTFALIAIGAMLHWLRTVSFVTGHVLYPAHITIAIALTVGLKYVSERHSLSRVVRAYTITALAFAALIAAPISIWTAYQPPQPITRADLPDLQGVPITFDNTVRLIGYTTPTHRLTSDLHQITLCWEILQETDRPAAFSVRFVDDGEQIGARTSIFGMGRWPSDLWRAGDIVCDAVDIPLIANRPDGQIYPILVSLLNPRTGDFDWQAEIDNQPVDYAFIGAVVQPAGDQSNELPTNSPTTDIMWPNFARLTGYALDDSLSAGATVNLSLLWSVDQTTADDWAFFVHLYGANQQVVLWDGQPRNGNYPTQYWAVSEQIVDHIPLTLPDDLPAGDYTLNVGFYRADTRMPVLHNGAPVPSGAAQLLEWRYTP